MTSSHVTNLGWWWLLRSTLPYVEDGWFLLLSSALSSSSIRYPYTRRPNRSFPVVLRFSYHTALTVLIGDDVVDNGKYFCWTQRLCVLELCELPMPMRNRLLTVEARRTRESQHLWRWLLVGKGNRRHVAVTCDHLSLRR